ncbi:MAG: hypothetical protein SangKO_057700 [Sandaracinaceae bacterium]
MRWTPLLLALLLAACGEPPADPDAATPADAGLDSGSIDPDSGAPMDDAATQEDAGPSCTLTLCGAECVDTDTSAAHCGGCDSPCEAPADGAAMCEGGACARSCDEGFALRGTECAPRPPWAGSDLDGDGLADVVVGSYGTVTIFTSIPGGDELSPDQTVRSPSGSDPNFGNPIALVGDVDGDGRGDLAVMSRGRGHVYVYRGTVGGVDATTPTELPGCTGGRDTCNGYRLFPAGDVNADGYADLLIARTTTVDFRSVETTVLHLGAAGGISTSPSTTWPDHTVMGAGDVDGDGDGDLLKWPDIGRLAWLESDAGSYTETPLVVPARFSIRALVGNADVNGDGYADIAVLDASGPRVVWWLGSSSGLVDAVAGSVDLPGGPAFWDFGSLARGDFDGDGYDDIVASQEADVTGSPDPVSITIFFGGPGGLDASRSLAFDRTSSDRGTPITGVGDVNGDGYGDFVVGANGIGPVELLAGGPRDITPTLGPRFLASGTRAGIALGESL